MGDNQPNSRAQATIPNVLLTEATWSTFSARLAIGFSKRGGVVSALCPGRNHPLLKTDAVRRVFPYSAFQPLKSLLAAIEATKPTVIIPCDDRSVLHLHEL